MKGMWSGQDGMKMLMKQEKEDLIELRYLDFIKSNTYNITSLHTAQSSNQIVLLRMASRHF